MFSTFLTATVRPEVPFPTPRLAVAVTVVASATCPPPASSQTTWLCSGQPASHQALGEAASALVLWV